MDDERRDADGGQHVADVALVDEADDRLRAAGGRRAALVAGPGAPDPLVVRDRRREQVDHHAAAGVALGDLEGRRELRQRCPDREVGRLEEPREAVDEDQARDALRMRRRERHREDPATDVGDQRRPLGADRVEDGRDVGHELLERRQRGGRDRIRQAGPPLVEHDQPPERGEALAELGERRHVPLRVQVAEPLVEQQDVGRALADDLVRKVEVAQAGVPGLGNHRGRPA